MEPTPERLDLTAYSYVTEIAPRFGDMDALRHLNNVALAGIYEEGRVRFTTAIGIHEAREQGCRPVIGELTIRYLVQAHYPAMLTAGIGVLRIGRSSYAFAQALFQDGRCVGLCDTTLVYTGAEDGRARPLPDAFRAVLAAHPLGPRSASPQTD